MTQRPPPLDADSFATTASRPASLWPESTRPSELRSSAFGSTLFGALPPPQAPVALPLFDVCHVGVVLRAVLFVQ